MAELTAAQRNALPDSDFAIVRMVNGEKQRDYPIDTRDRAIDALGRVEQDGTDKDKAAVKAAVCRRYQDLPACSAATNALKAAVHHSMTQKRDGQGNFAT
jgi:hypothetical protein